MWHGVGPSLLFVGPGEVSGLLAKQPVQRDRWVSFGGDPKAIICGPCTFFSEDHFPATGLPRMAEAHPDSGQILSLGVLWALDTSVGLSVVSSKGSALAYASGSRLTCQSVRAAVPGVGEVLFDSPSCPRPRAHRTPKFLTCRGEQEISRNPNSPQDNALQGNPSLISRGELHLNTPLTSFTPESPGSLCKTPIPGPGSLLS